MGFVTHKSEFHIKYITLFFIFRWKTKPPDTQSVLQYRPIPSVNILKHRFGSYEFVQSLKHNSNSKNEKCTLWIDSNFECIHCMRISFTRKNAISYYDYYTIIKLIAINEWENIKHRHRACYRRSDKNRYRADNIFSSRFLYGVHVQMQFTSGI